MNETDLPFLFFVLFLMKSLLFSLNLPHHPPPVLPPYILIQHPGHHLFLTNIGNGLYFSPQTSCFIIIALGYTNGLIAISFLNPRSKRGFSLYKKTRFVLKRVKIKFLLADWLTLLPY